MCEEIDLYFIYRYYENYNSFYEYRNTNLFQIQFESTFLHKKIILVTNLILDFFCKVSKPHKLKYVLMFNGQ